MTIDSRPPQSILRSVLFLPASNARAVEKARTLGVDAVVLDLEDAVAPDAKADARHAALAALRAGGFGEKRVAVRANPLDSAWGREDFAALADSGVGAIVVPKVDSAGMARAAVAAAGGKPVWAMIESPAGVIAAPAIAATPGVDALIAGVNDLAKGLHALPGADRTALLYALSAIVIAARAGGSLCFDGVHVDIANLETLAATSAQGRALGFDGRTIIHPSHIDTVNAAYSPSAAAVADARDLVAGHEAAGAEAKGVATHRGRMIEALHVEEARRLIAFAEAIGR